MLASQCESVAFSFFCPVITPSVVWRSHSGAPSLLLRWPQDSGAGDEFSFHRPADSESGGGGDDDSAGSRKSAIDAASAAPLKPLPPLPPLPPLGAGLRSSSGGGGSGSGGGPLSYSKPPLASAAARTTSHQGGGEASEPYELPEDEDDDVYEVDGNDLF